MGHGRYATPDRTLRNFEAKIRDNPAMLCADRILKTPLVAAALGILGSIMGIPQIALAVQASVAALRMMGIVTEGA
jgi:hypothetical protein